MGSVSQYREYSIRKEKIAIVVKKFKNSAPVSIACCQLLW
jgi:hypothetical protein